MGPGSGHCLPSKGSEVRAHVLYEGLEGSYDGLV